MKADIRKLLGTDALIIGSERTMKALRAGELKQVLLSSNCDPSLKDTADHYAKLAGVEVVQLDVPNEELGVFCKKPFNIQLLGIRA